jgi:hypothetical protein
MKLAARAIAAQTPFLAGIASAGNTQGEQI